MSWGAVGATVAGAVVSHNSEPSGGGSSGGRVAEFELEQNPFFTATVDATKGRDFLRSGAAGELLDFQKAQLAQAGLFGGQVGDNRAADLAGQLGFSALQGLQRSTFDPITGEAFDLGQIAQEQFDQIFPVLDRIQQRDANRLENRLFQQGQLGGTPGDLRQFTLLDAQEDARRKLLFESLQQGLNARNQQFNFATGLLNLDPTLRGAFQTLGTNALANVLNIQGAANQTFSTLAGAQGGGVASQQPLSTGQVVGGGLLNSGVQGLSSAIDRLFQPTNPGTTGSTLNPIENPAL